MNAQNTGPVSLAPRLKCAADMIRKNCKMADIGTDHAYLPIWLAQRGIISHAVASDIRKGPYLSAKNNVNFYGVSDMVDVRLGGGLEPIEADEIDDIVICGMGGEMIVNILDSCPYISNKRYNLILQPMSRAEVLRRYLCEKGFSVLQEQAVYDSGRYYVVIRAAFTGVYEKKDDVFYYTGLLSPQDNCAKQYLLGIKKHVQNLLKGCMACGNTDGASSLKNIISAIENAVFENTEN